MSKDISTIYTKDQNQKAGRRGYGNWKSDKESHISPAEYGGFIEKARKRRKWYENLSNAKI